MKNERLPWKNHVNGTTLNRLLSQVREHLDINPEEGTEPGNYEGSGQFCMEMVKQSELVQREICWRSWP